MIHNGRRHQGTGKKTMLHYDTHPDNATLRHTPRQCYTTTNTQTMLHYDTNPDNATLRHAPRQCYSTTRTQTMLHYDTHPVNATVRHTPRQCYTTTRTQTMLHYDTYPDEASGVVSAAPWDPWSFPQTKRQTLASRWKRSPGFQRRSGCPV